MPAPSDPRCLIDYSKNRDRDYYYDYLTGAHEGRFDMINKNPYPLSQFKHLAIPSFKKYSKRKPLFLSSAKYPIDYRIDSGLQSIDPINNEHDFNNALGKFRNLSTGIPEFGKMTKRKELNIRKPFVIPEGYDPWKLSKGIEA